MKRARLGRRLGNRFGTTVIICALIFLLIVIMGIVSGLHHSFYPRETVVIASSPVSVWSYDREDHTLTVLIIPSDYFIDAIHGYGEYSLESLWKLGFIDTTERSLMSESVGDTLGLSIPWYIGENSEELPHVHDSVAYGKSIFSLASVGKLFSGLYRSNMPITSFISFMRNITSVSLDNMTVIDLSQKDITEEQVLPDQTTREHIDPDQVDLVLKGVFEDETIRKERVSVALYNTTQVPDLANRAARLVSAMGVLVVAVSNEEPAVSRCQLYGTAPVLSSKTAHMIADLFKCQTNISSSQNRADLMVLIGTEYAARFQP